MRSVQKVSSHVLSKIEISLKKIQETLYTGQWCLSPLQSRHLETSHRSSSISSTFKTWSWSCCDFAVPCSGVENQATSIGMTGPWFLGHRHRPMIHLWYDLLEEIWFIGSSLNQVISNRSTMIILVAEAEKWILPRHVPQQDPGSKSQTH